MAQFRKHQYITQTLLKVLYLPHKIWENPKYLEKFAEFITKVYITKLKLMLMCFYMEFSFVYGKRKYFLRFFNYLLYSNCARARLTIFGHIMTPYCQRHVESTL